MTREELLTGKLKRLMLTRIILSVIFPVVLVSFTVIVSALFPMMEFFQRVAISWQLNLFLSPILIGSPIFFYYRLNKIHRLFEQRQHDDMVALYKPTVYTYILSFPVYSLLAFLGAAALGYPWKVTLISGGYSFGYIGVGSIPFMLIFIVALDRYYQEISFSKSTLFSIRLKFRFTSILSTVSGTAVLVLCMYTLFWRYEYYPEWALTFDQVVNRMLILMAWITTAMLFPNQILGNYITSNIQQIRDYSQKIRNKDLTSTLQVTSRDELGIALDNVRMIGDTFREIISQLKENTMFLKNSSLDLKQHAQMISDIASNQAANAEELSASMEEIGSNLELVAESTQSSDVLTQSSKTFIEAGEVSMNVTLSNIQEITLKVENVEELAGQTNLLAVNASIEANSAGVYGKGFAVIAREVRALADRSKESATQITQLARECLENSTDLKEKIVEVSSKITESKEMASQIANATNEQKVSTDQINGTVQELNHNAQQLSASAEELASSSTELSGKAVRLDELVSGFEV